MSTCYTSVDGLLPLKTSSIGKTQACTRWSPTYDMSAYYIYYIVVQKKKKKTYVSNKTESKDVTRVSKHT